MYFMGTSIHQKNKINVLEDESLSRGGICQNGICLFFNSVLSCDVFIFALFYLCYLSKEIACDGN